MRGSRAAQLGVLPRSSQPGGKGRHRWIRRHQRPLAAGPCGRRRGDQRRLRGARGPERLQARQVHRGRRAGDAPVCRADHVGRERHRSSRQHRAERAERNPRRSTCGIRHRGRIRRCPGTRRRQRLVERPVASDARRARATGRGGITEPRPTRRAAGRRSGQHPCLPDGVPQRAGPIAGRQDARGDRDDPQHPAGRCPSQCRQRAATGLQRAGDIEHRRGQGHPEQRRAGAVTRQVPAVVDPRRPGGHEIAGSQRHHPPWGERQPVDRQGRGHGR